MRKRIIVLILLSVFIITMFGCSANNQASTIDTNDPDENGRQNTLENPIAITDENGAKLGEIDNRANFTAVDEGIFYSVFTLKEYSHTGTAEYRFFSLKDKTDVYLGKLEDQGYEADFTRTELNGVIYTLAVKGDPTGDEAVPLLLLAFDAANKTMKTYTVSEHGFPYAAMTASGGKLIIMNHEMTSEKADKIYEFDPISETIREILTFSSSTDSLRSVCAADNGFYLLRLKLNNGGQNEMYVDRYDENHEKISERPVGDVLADVIKDIHGISGRQDAMNEIGMNVSHFFMADDRYMIYENFGLSRIVIDLQTEETLFAKDDNYAVSNGSGVPVVYKVDYGADNVSDPEIYGIENGTLKRFSFVPDDDHRLIRTVTVSTGGTWAILTSDAFPVQKGTGVIHVWSAQ